MIERVLYLLADLRRPILVIGVALGIASLHAIATGSSVAAMNFLSEASAAGALGVLGSAASRLPNRPRRT